MKLTATTFVSLDGVYQAPGGPEEDPSGGFELGGWSSPYGGEDFGRFVLEALDQADAFLLGRRTYDIFSAFWPHVTDENDPVAGRLNALPKYVASTTLESADWANTTVLRGDIVEEVARLKSQPGREIQVHGSGGLLQTLMRHDLVDEYRLLVYPVVLGSGLRLFREGARPTAMKLADSRTTSSGVTINILQPIGAPQVGSLAAQES
jgi:dihydrofolate reductase